jgi:hypothetical protein
MCAIDVTRPSIPGSLLEPARAEGKHDVIVPHDRGAWGSCGPLGPQCHLCNKDANGHVSNRTKESDPGLFRWSIKKKSVYACAGEEMTLAPRVRKKDGMGMGK